MVDIACFERTEGTGIGYVLSLLENLRKESGAFTAAVSLSCACSREHLESAFEKAVRNFQSGRSRARSAEGEFFRVLAMENQIRDAIEKCGISEADGVFCIVFGGDGLAELSGAPGLKRIPFPPCGKGKLRAMGFSSEEDLLEAVAFFDAGILE